MLTAINKKAPATSRPPAPICNPAATKFLKMPAKPGKYWGERRDLNPRPPGPQPGALPSELRPPSASYLTQDSSPGKDGGLRKEARPALIPVRCRAWPDLLSLAAARILSPGSPLHLGPQVVI